MVFDIETDGFIEKMTRIHCLHIYDLDTHVLHRYDKERIPLGLNRLQAAHEIIGHNIIGFDISAIQKLYPQFTVQKESSCPTQQCGPKVTDTLLFSKLAYQDMWANDDKGFMPKQAPKNLRGRHSLKSWGYRLKMHKGEYGENHDDPWSRWNQEMSDYCAQDVMLNVKVYEHLVPLLRDDDDEWIEAVGLEHDVAWIIQRQEQWGFWFDHEKAERLYCELTAEREKLEGELTRVMPPFIQRTPFVPKRDNSRLGYKAGVRVIKEKTIPFNPGSRLHIANAFKVKYGWTPTETTNDGRPKVDEAVLSKLNYPEAKLLVKYLLVQKRLGQIGDGRNGWLKLYDKDSRIHGRVNTNGCVTGRMTHNGPNVAQVPSVRAPYGLTCRECFGVTPGRNRKQVGVDASGLELRMLAHYMARWDNGEYGHEVHTGDPHTGNQRAAGLPTRDDAKRFIYAFLYGGGDKLIGSIIGKGAKEGRAIKRRFYRALPALDRLAKSLATVVAERRSIRGLDGRTIPVRSAHRGLNCLLQSAGAIVMKRALVLADRKLRELGFTPFSLDPEGGDYEFIANIHDEFQLECRSEIADSVKQAVIDAITYSSPDLRVPLAAEGKVGENWADCH